MDGKSTPTAHTFDATRLSNGKLKATNRASPTIETQEVLVIEVKNGNASKGAQIHVSLGLPVPRTDVNTGAVSVGYVNSFVGDFNVSNQSTVADRKDLRKMVHSLIDQALFGEVVDDVEPVYG